MQSLPKPLTTLLAFLALAGAQVFGLQRGYVCLCNEVPVETSAPHCGLSEDACGHEHEEGDDGEKHQHAPLTVELEAQGSGSMAAPLQAPVFLAVLSLSPWWDAPSCGMTAAQVRLRPPPVPALSPTAALMVAECLVMLV